MPETLLAGGLTTPYRIAIDQADDRLYCTSLLGNAIYSATLSGTNATQFRETTGLPAGIAIAAPQRYLYWSIGQRVWRQNLATGAAGQLPFLAPDLIQDLAVDEVAGKLYVSSTLGFGSNGRVLRANLDGLNLETIASGIQSGPFGLALDQAQQRVYWGTVGGIYRAGFDGSSPMQISAEAADSLALDPGQRKLYWTRAFNTGISVSLRRANLDGSGVEVLSTSLFTGGIAFVPEPSPALLLALAIAFQRRG